jgi:hypothetical protein
MQFFNMTNKTRKNLLKHTPFSFIKYCNNDDSIAFLLILEVRIPDASMISIFLSRRQTIRAISYPDHKLFIGFGCKGIINFNTATKAAPCVHIHRQTTPLRHTFSIM